MRQWTAIVAALALAAAAGGTGSAMTAGGEDDLAIVKKAVASPAPARANRPAVAATAQVGPATALAPERVVRRAGQEPRWFKLRVVDRTTGRKKVTVNLPLSLVRALGDDTVDWGCRHGGEPGERCHTVRLSEVLRTLEAGQDLVEIEDEDATVRVWVE